ncbi:MAG: pyridoxamine 5'-phosphate oxidase family protein [Candidatus Odinarchaeota archaeon]
MKVRKVIDKEKYLQNMKIPLRLSCVTQSGWPMVLSLWYLYQNEKFYLATPKKAKVVDYLINEPRCAFEVANEKPPYRGIRGQGKTTINSKKGEEILTLLLERYLGNLDSPLAKELLSKSKDEVAIEITPLKIFTWDFTERMGSSLSK